MRENQNLSRRQFLMGSGLVVAGTAVGAVGFNSPQPAAVEWPWTYQPIDAKKAAQIAYDGYIGGHN